MLRLLSLLFLSNLHQSLGTFTLPTCWPGSTLCVQQNSQGAWCYVPKAGETALTDCKGAQTDLQSVLDVHLNQDLSIAYYNGADNTRLGGASWPVPANAGIIRLCASGRSGDGVLQTICMNIAADNTFSGSPYCEVALGPPIVSDGCYSALLSSTPNIPPTTSSQSQVPATSSTMISSTTNMVASSSSSIATSESSTSSSSSSNTVLPTSNTTFTIVDEHKTNKTTEIAVPLVVAILGLLAAAFGLWKYRS